MRAALMTIVTVVVVLWAIRDFIHGLRPPPP
jgi:hypothetical protein